MLWTRRRGTAKYGNKTCSCLSGHIHDSRGEAGYCDALALMKKAKQIVGYKTQVTFDLSVAGKKVCGHRVDFLVDLPNGRQEVHEFKGFSTPEWAIKHKLFVALYPTIEYKVIRPSGGRR